ncbi:amidohydrolase family protein [Hymenobacter cellulosivorans]|uniref:Amidohydrolase family protein n=1 Tax=Hymenobacter cellulosivorans TaxID=2932249 RepID=A0ABY4F4B3_9BACT|nr:amidohydrolase family protein [Hymenobacter cellulosivorans]UOQ51487.1 amidohydrolase family protein [Hymenobacter cellulosivorans]
MAALLGRYLFAQARVAEPAPADLALVGAKIYPSPEASPILNGVVLLRQGKIAAVGTARQVRIPAHTPLIDCRGMVLTAGFWNCHVHFIEPKWLRADTIAAPRLSRQLQQMLTRYGFTYAFDLATLDLKNLLRLRARIATGLVPGPTILSAGEPFTPPAGNPAYIEPLQLAEANSPEQAAQHVQGQLAAGADAIKMWSASPTGRAVVPMPLATIRAAVAVAHAHQKPVFAHPTNLLGVSLAAQGGVDILTHVAPDDRRVWDTQTVQAMRAANMALIPTLKLFKWELEQAGIPPDKNALLQVGQQQLNVYAQAGGEILFGTDVGYMRDYSPADEYLLMNQAGLRFPQILAALTTAPARRFGRDAQTGKVAKGMSADLVILRSDPATDVRAFADVAYTLHQGKLLYSQAKKE